MRYQWIIFDADGTLFDYDSAESDALYQTFTYFQQKYQPEYIKYYHDYNKRQWDAFEQGAISIDRLKIRRFQLLLDKLGIDADPHNFSEQYLLNLSRGTQLIDGAEKVLKMLNGNIGLILMTNGIKEVQRSRLSLSTISIFFSDIIISDEVGVAKPDKRIFEIALKRMSAPDKNEVLMIGDNISSDIKGGVDFGIPTCWYNPHKRDPDPLIRADYEIHDLHDIPSLVGIE